MPDLAGVGTRTQRVEGRGRKNQLRRGAGTSSNKWKEIRGATTEASKHESREGQKSNACRIEKCDHCTTQQPPLPAPGDEYGSSFFATGPHTDGTYEEISMCA